MDEKEDEVGVSPVAGKAPDDVKDSSQLAKRCKMDKEDGELNEGELNSEVGQLNPLLVSLVLEKVFSFFQDSLPDLKNFRGVCKTWEKEVIKGIRRKAKVDVRHLCGQSLLAEHETPPPSVYDAENAPFENIKLQGTCDVLKDPCTIAWISTNGAKIKRLHFQSSLVCYHQTRFLECVLKIWCKNLTSLFLEDVGCLNNLSQFGVFDSTPFVCHLKEFMLSCDVTGNLFSRNCEKGLVLKYLTFEDTTFTPRSVALRIREAAASGLHPRQFNISKETLASSFRSTSKAENGVLGEILENNEIERIVIKAHGIIDVSSLLRHLKDSKTISTLRSLEYENFLMMKDSQIRTIQRLGLQLSKICMGTLMSQVQPGLIEELLSSYSDTLQHLELGGNVLLENLEDEEEQEFIQLRIPQLPNVTTFINGNIFCTRLGGLDFVENLPKLKKCSLTNAISHSSIYPLNPSQVFNLLFQSSIFEKREHPLTELTLDGNAKISFARHVELLQQWFPQLRKVDLILDGSDVFVDFFSIMKGTVLEDIKLSFYSNDTEWINAGIGNCVGKYKKLQFLEMIHLADHPLVISTNTCANGFAQVPLLTSLKLENFGMFADEVEAIRASLSGINFVRFPKCVVQHRPANVEFSMW